MFDGRGLLSSICRAGPEAGIRLRNRRPGDPCDGRQAAGEPDVERSQFIRPERLVIVYRLADEVLRPPAGSRPPAAITRQNPGKADIPASDTALLPGLDGLFLGIYGESH